MVVQSWDARVEGRARCSKVFLLDLQVRQRSEVSQIWKRALIRHRLLPIAYHLLVLIGISQCLFFGRGINDPYLQFLPEWECPHRCGIFWYWVQWPNRWYHLLIKNLFVSIYVCVRWNFLWLRTFYHAYILEVCGYILRRLELLNFCLDLLSLIEELWAAHLRFTSCSTKRVARSIDLVMSDFLFQIWLDSWRIERVRPARVRHQLMVWKNVGFDAAHWNPLRMHLLRHHLLLRTLEPAANMLCCRGILGEVLTLNDLLIVKILRGLLAMSLLFRPRDTIYLHWCFRNRVVIARDLLWLVLRRWPENRVVEAACRNFVWLMITFNRLWLIAAQTHFRHR